MATPTPDTLDFIEAISLLIRRVRSAATARDSSALSLTEASILGRLDRHGPATTADLARAEAITPQSMGTLIAALEQRGAVTRTPHATDGRQRLVSLTPEGSHLRARIRQAKHSWFADRIATLPPADRDTLFAAGAILRRLAEQ